MKTFRLPRRTLLAGLGAGLALPALDAMLTDRGLVYDAHAQAQAQPVRFLTFFIPNGVPLHYPQGKTDEYRWFPREEGDKYTMTMCLQPIADYRARFNVLNGIVLGQSCADGHAGGTTGFATGLPPTTSGAQGPSIDQVAAEQLGKTTFKSLGVGVKAIDTPFNDFNISTFDELSWAGKEQPAPLRRDPAKLFTDLFSGSLPDTSGEAERRKKYRLSVLDFVSGDANRLKQRLGKSDNIRLDAHLAAIRDLESRVMGAQAVTCAAPMKSGAAMGYVDKAKLQAELFAMALKCDLTRYGAYMYGHGGNDGGGEDKANGLVAVNGEYPQQHNFTHELADPNKYDALFKSITDFTLAQMGVFKHFLDKLQEGSNGPDDFLQHTLIYFGSELGDGVNHDNVGNVLPILLVGNAGGQLKTGRHIKFPGNVPAKNLHLTALKMAGVTIDSFAGSRETVTL